MTKWYKKFEQGSEMFFMFKDFWNLVQNYWTVEDVDEYWDVMIRDCESFKQKYPKYFPGKLIIAFIDEQDRKRKRFPDDYGKCTEMEQEVKRKCQ